MNTYLLDTTALINFSKGIEPTTTKLIQMIDNDDTLAVCAIPIAEFYAGLLPKERNRWQEFLNLLTYWDITPDMAMLAGIERYNFARKGKTISTADILIAAVAKAYHATILTDNVKDFPMKDVKIISLQYPAIKTAKRKM